ncbi:hypothetical protein [Thermoflexus hugenholtzii]
MKNKNSWFVGMGILLVLAFSLPFIWGHAFAQQEQPLAKMALREEELPRGFHVLHAGPIQFEDLSHPLNSENTLPVVHRFLEAYKISFLGENVHGGHYLYRYKDPKQAEEQATRLVTYISQEAQRLQPVRIDNGSALPGQKVKGQAFRFTDPETAGVFYWFIGVKERTLMMLLVVGPPNEETGATFELLKQHVQSR